MNSNVGSDSPEYQRFLAEALANCEKEPIHLIGTVQPNGVLIAVNPEQWTVRAVSSNLHLLSCAAESALGQPLADVLGNRATDDLKRLARTCTETSAAIGSIVPSSADRNFSVDAQVFRAGADIVIELELESPPGGDVFHKLFVPIRDALWRLDAEEDMLRYADAVVGQVRLLTGFDRVMMYRFDDNWDGEVIAESKIEEAGSYLGNRFPASDIPSQARQLYVLNLVRLLSDIEAAQVPILTQTPDNHGVDLSLSWLRSVSPVHVEYLRNMGVRATLGISLVQNGRLWGLIACHHFSPKYVSIRERELNELIGRTVSLKLIYMENAERSSLNAQVRSLLFRFTEGIRDVEDIHAAIASFREELLGVVGASGVIVTIGGIQHHFGELPPIPAIRSLLNTLENLPVAPIISTECVADLCAEMSEYRDIASGMILVPLAHPMLDFVMWFRPAVLRTVRWAGQPPKTVINDERGLRISPRKSFDTWIETYRDKAAPCSQVQIDAVNSMSLALIKMLTQQALRSREESYRLVAENSTDMIASLDSEWQFRFVSPASRELLGIEPSQLLGKSFADMVSDKDAPLLLR
ncbi:MAG: GAF domain-containing protein, partial [Methylococcaceae bacterium]|nr:GAF domain-containing protein [Methylococcaceae bacterium]